MGEKDRHIGDSNSQPKERPEGSRTALFIHAGSLSGGIDALGIREDCLDLDFEELLKWAAGKGTMAFARYYSNSSVLVQTKENVAFLKRLSSFGITTKSARGGADVWRRIVQDMHATVQLFDRAVLVSSKASLVPAIRHLIDSDKKVTVLSPWSGVNLPSEMRNSGAEIVLLSDVLPDLTMRRVPIPQRVEKQETASAPVAIFQAGSQIQPA